MLINLCRVARKVLGLIGLRKTAFALRRLIIDVKKDALVLEIGSGNKPYPRADILLDASMENYERAGNLVVDRPLVIGIGERLPFKDKSFDFVIASHVLEHTSHPRLFIEEMMRVGKAGYIEVPEAWIEHLNSWEIHRSEISVVDGVLVIREKSKPICDEFVRQSFLERAFKKKSWRRFINHHPMLSICQYYWLGSINYRIENEGASLSWDVPMALKTSDKDGKKVLVSLLKSVILRMAGMIFRLMFRQQRKMDLLLLLKCVECESEELIERQDKIVCSKCLAEYEYLYGIPKMEAKNIRDNLDYL